MEVTGEIIRVGPVYRREPSQWDGKTDRDHWVNTRERRSAIGRWRDACVLAHVGSAAHTQFLFGRMFSACGCPGTSLAERSCAVARDGGTRRRRDHLQGGTRLSLTGTIYARRDEGRAQEGESGGRQDRVEKTPFPPRQPRNFLPRR